VQTVRYGRIWLDGFQHPGDTVSMTCLKELVLTAEQHAGVRPRRRPELVTQRIETLQPSRRHWESLCTHHETLVAQLEAQQVELIGRQYQLQQRLAQATAPSLQARFSRQIATIQHRLPKLQVQQVYRQAVLAGARERVHQLRTEQARLQVWQAQLAEENRLNPDAPVCVCRNDAGFCSGENLTWQIEMGYQVETKSASGKLSRVLQQRCVAQTPWMRVGENAEMTDWASYRLNECPYPLRVGLERFRLGHQTKHSVLITYRDTPYSPDLCAWFKHYNGRQSIEAGNKQMKTVYHVQHLMSHAQYGIQVQVLLTGLSCNLTQFVQPWLQLAAEPFTSELQADLSSPKTMVRILANSNADVQRTANSTVVVFGSISSVPELKLCLRGLPLHQLNLGLFQPLQKPDPKP